MSENKGKTTTKKTAFQNDKAQKAAELKKKRGRPKKKTASAGTKSSAGAKSQAGAGQGAGDPGGVDREMCLQEAQMFLDTIDALRRSAGISKAVPDNQKAMFAQSYYQISLKYGANMAKYMPEMMFGLSSGLILLDTFKEFKILRAAQEAEKKRQESADRRDTPRPAPAAVKAAETAKKMKEARQNDQKMAEGEYMKPAKPITTERPFVIDGGETPTQ